MSPPEYGRFERNSGRSEGKMDRTDRKTTEKFKEI